MILQETLRNARCWKFWVIMMGLRGLYFLRFLYLRKNDSWINLSQWSFEYPIEDPDEDSFELAVENLPPKFLVHKLCKIIYLTSWYKFLRVSEVWVSETISWQYKRLWKNLFTGIISLNGEILDFDISKFRNDRLQICITTKKFFLYPRYSILTLWK